MTIPPRSKTAVRHVQPTSHARQRLIQARALTPQSPLLDARQAAKLLGVPPTWLLAQARAERVPHRKLGHYVRFDMDELIAWVDSQRVAPRPR